MNKTACLLCCMVLCFAMVGCNTYRYTENLPSASFDEALSLGQTVLTLEKSLENEPVMHASFYRKTLKTGFGLVGDPRALLFLPYPTLAIDKNYNSTKLSGQKLSEHAWRFHLPRMQWWGQPNTISISYLPVGEKSPAYLLFQVLPAEPCLSNYKLEDELGNLVKVNATMKSGLCLLPCSPSIYDPDSCGNRWSPVTH